MRAGPAVREAPVPVHGTAPDGLLEAFWAYDRALLANDTAAMAALFAPGPDTLRGDGTRVLVGHDRITAFRSARAARPTRRVTGLHVRVLTAGTALVMAETADPDGAGTGLQTQVWAVESGAWWVRAAHVTQPQRRGPALDGTVWRVLGDPLVPAAGHGPLTGLGVAVKDVFAVAGHRVGGGNPTLLAGVAPAQAHAAAVAALLDAGASVTGIARTDEFAYSLAGTNAHYGTPPNPAAPDRIPGGSSSGPASAVASGAADVGLGTDTAGSIRVPASYQGLFGLRSTHGLLDRTGMLPLAPSFDTVGWVTRDAATLAAVAAALLPPGHGVPLRRALVLVPAGIDDDARAGFDAAVAGLLERGVLDSADPAPPGPDPDERAAAFRTVQGHEARAAHGAWADAHPGALGPDVAARFAAAALITGDDARAARAVLDRTVRWLRELLAPGTVLLTPAASGAAPHRDDDRGGAAVDATVEAARAATLRATCLASAAGVPAVAMPLARAGGAPLGVSALGARGADRDLVDLAARACSDGQPGRSTGLRRVRRSR